MSYPAQRVLLERLFAHLNAANAVPSPDEVWRDYALQINQLLRSSDNIRREFTSVSNDIKLPKALEAARILQNLRQRFDQNRGGNQLVGRIRAAVVQKDRPTRNQARDRIEGIGRDIVRLTPERYTHFSKFQVEGWQKVLSAINNRDGIVVVAPTSSGKTEVFLLPVVYAIAQAIRRDPNNALRFVVLYPRVPLLKDQLARIFRYVYYAEQAYLSAGGMLFGSSQVTHKIVIGFQFSGIYSNATGNNGTLSNRDIFAEDRTFQIVELCPICEQGKLRAAAERQNNILPIRCDNPLCKAEFHTSIAKNDHANTRPHLLVTTVESLDRLYLNPKFDFENYLRQLSGIIFDEVHLYYSIYGVHIYNLISRLEDLQDGQRLARIASSATVSNPERFAAKFFYGDENHHVNVHDANEKDSQGQLIYEQSPASLEILYFLQSPEGRNNVGAAPTLIQSVMAMGHGVLSNDDRALVFTDSLDMAGRLTAQITDAERNRRLWEFRTLPHALRFQNLTCSRTSPSNCPIYLAGECWRGILSGSDCLQPINALRESPLRVLQVSSKQQNDYRDGHIVVATPTLEVGVDDEHIKSTIHYLPPRTVFSFIQKRGRAGRAAGETAYTLMVLGTTPSDHFYLFRRNRLVNGTYELPLNPQNDVVRMMHDLIQRERQCMGQHFREARENAIQGIWRWIWETLNRCQIIRRYYSRQLIALDRFPRKPQEQTSVRCILQNWIQTEKEKLENDLSLEQLLQEIREKSPYELHNTVQATLNAVNSFLSNEGISAQEVGQQLGRLDSELGARIFFNEEPDLELLEEINALQNKVRQTWLSVRRQQHSGIGLRHAECLYDFFRTLEKLCDEDKILNMAPDALKIVLQAMFYLHLGLEEIDEPGGCQSRVEYYVPNAYFQTVKPIVVAVHHPEVWRSPDLEQENVTELSTTFIPYKPVYRYHTPPYLSILDIEQVSNDRQTVTIRLHAEGVTRGGVKFPKKVHVKPVWSDEQGQQIVKFCPRCYAIHDLKRSWCHCHENLHKVKLYAEPIVDRRYEALVTPRRITQNFQLLEKMRGTTTVSGSSVQAKRVRFDEERRCHILLQGQNNQFTFNALYETPVRYGIPTKGITWNLAEVVGQVLEDNDLYQRVRQVVVEGRHKELNEELVLHTASHLLHRAIAAITGVNEQELEYWFDVNSREVVVWERYEGGAGISEVFENTLRTDLVEVYRELLASVLCPVALAENPDWTSADELRSELAQSWCLSLDDELIARVVQEAEAERQVQAQQQNEEDRSRMFCRPPRGHDGCPACIHTTYCTDRDNQDLSVSRLVGEAILHCFVQRLSREKAEALMNAAIFQGITPPYTLSADPALGMFDVLLL